MTKVGIGVQRSLESFVGRFSQVGFPHKKVNNCVELLDYEAVN